MSARSILRWLAAWATLPQRVAALEAAAKRRADVSIAISDDEIASARAKLAELGAPVDALLRRINRRKGL